MSMRKNRIDHSGDTGSCATTSGYATKAKPAPKQRKDKTWELARNISYALVWKAAQRCILMFKDPGPILVDFQTGNLFEGAAVD